MPENIYERYEFLKFKCNKIFNGISEQTLWLLSHEYIEEIQVQKGVLLALQYKNSILRKCNKNYNLFSKERIKSCIIQII